METDFSNIGSADIMNLKIISPDGVVFDGEAKVLDLINDLGHFSIFPYHETFISMIKEKVIVYDKTYTQKEIAIEGGIIKVYMNKVEIFLGLGDGSWRLLKLSLLEGNFYAILSFSNAKFLSREIATALRGRTITFEVYPLSFVEFVNIISPALNPDGSAGKAALVNLFDRFMHQGGFPELVKQDMSLKDKILQEYFNVMVFRDLIERYQISQAAILKYFCKRVIGASACEFSVNKIYNELRSQNYQVSKDTLYSYQGYVEAIYLNRFISKYSHSVVRAESSQKKTYVIDQGLGAVLDYKFSLDKGRLLETTVALELLKQGKQVAYKQNGSGCDFIIIKNGEAVQAIQVTSDFTDTKTREREVKGIVSACKEFGLRKGTILSFDHEEKLEFEGIEITVIPAWKYFFS